MTPRDRRRGDREPTDELVSGRRPIETATGPPLRVLHLIVALGHSNTQYNEHCLPMKGRRDISICSFSPAQLEVPPGFSVFEGDGSVRGFRRALDRALDQPRYDIVHAHAPGTAALLALTNILRKRSMTNVVLTVHNSRQSFPLRNRTLLKVLFAAFPTIAFCSDAAMNSFPNWMRRLIRGRATVIPNGVDLERIDRTLGVLPTRGHRPGLDLVAVGRLIHRKDPITLVQAFALDAREQDTLTFIGDGQLKSHVLREAELSNLTDSVTVTGTIPREAVYARVAGSDVAVSASRGEGLPVAVLELMACGVPVIASDIPPHREIDPTGEVLSFVPPGDTLGFSRSIRRLQHMSMAQRQAIGARGRALVEEKFGLDRMHRAYGELYEEVRSAMAATRPLLPKEAAS